MQQYVLERNKYKNQYPVYSNVEPSTPDEDIVYDFVLKVWDESIPENDPVIEQYKYIKVSTLYGRPGFERGISQDFFPVDAHNIYDRNNRKARSLFNRGYEAMMAAKGKWIDLQVIGLRNKYWVTNTKINYED